jgi:hypothetical protein
VDENSIVNVPSACSFFVERLQRDEEIKIRQITKKEDRKVRGGQMVWELN